MQSCTSQHVDRSSCTVAGSSPHVSRIIYTYRDLGPSKKLGPLTRLNVFVLVEGGDRLGEFGVVHLLSRLERGDRIPREELGGNGVSRR
jgi:hypothetical protein